MKAEVNFTFKPIPVPRPRPKLRQLWHSMARAGEMVGERIIGTMIGHDQCDLLFREEQNSQILPRGRVGFNWSVHWEHCLV